MLELTFFDTAGSALGAYRHHFSRRFAFVPRPRQPPQRVELEDDRVPADGSPRRFTVAIPEGCASVRYTLDYERVLDPEDGRVEGRIRIAEGMVP